MSNDKREELYITVKINVSESYDDFDGHWYVDGPSTAQVIDTNMDDGHINSMTEHLGQSDFYTLGFPYGIAEAFDRAHSGNKLVEFDWNY